MKKDKIMSEKIEASNQIFYWKIYHNDEENTPKYSSKKPTENDDFYNVLTPFSTRNEGCFSLENKTFR